MLQVEVRSILSNNPARSASKICLQDTISVGLEVLKHHQTININTVKADADFHQGLTAEKATYKSPIKARRTYKSDKQYICLRYKLCLPCFTNYLHLSFLSFWLINLMHNKKHIVIPST